MLTAGVPLANAKGVVILLHGRGASAEDILGLAAAFEQPDWAYLAPAAAGHSWYPNSFLAPFEKNEPWLTSALQKIGATVEQALSAGIPRDKIIIAGFSQGACLATEFTARSTEWAGRAAGVHRRPDRTSRGPSSAMPWQVWQRLRRFLGAGDPDAHVPWERVEESAAILRSLGAEVTLRRYPGLPHTISRDEIEEAKKLIAATAVLSQTPYAHS